MTAGERDATFQSLSEYGIAIAREKKRKMLKVTLRLLRMYKVRKTPSKQMMRMQGFSTLTFSH